VTSGGVHIELVHPHVAGWNDGPLRPSTRTRREGRVTLELTPTNEWGADLARLTRFYVSLGFAPNSESQWPFRWQAEMIRRPAPGRRHGLQ